MASCSSPLCHDSPCSSNPGSPPNSVSYMGSPSSPTYQGSPSSPANQGSPGSPSPPGSFTYLGSPSSSPPRGPPSPPGSPVSPASVEFNPRRRSRFFCMRTIHLNEHLDFEDLDPMEDENERDEDKKTNLRACRRFLLNPVGPEPQHYSKHDWVQLGGDSLPSWRQKLAAAGARVKSMGVGDPTLETLIPGLPDDIVAQTIWPKVEAYQLRHVQSYPNFVPRLSDRLTKSCFEEMGSLRTVSNAWRKLSSVSLNYSVLELIKFVFSPVPPTCGICKRHCPHEYEEFVDKETERWGQNCWRLFGISELAGFPLVERLAFAKWFVGIEPEE